MGLLSRLACSQRLRRLQLDLDLHTSGELQGHQGLHGLGGGLDDVDEALVGAALELLAGVLVLVNRAQDGDCLLYTSLVKVLPEQMVDQMATYTSNLRLKITNSMFEMKMIST